MMNNKAMRVQESVRMFVGMEVPGNVREHIRRHLRGYNQFTKKLVPEENWHVTLLFIGEIPGYEKYMEPLSTAMPQIFIPTLSLTHIGRGLQREQLWAFAKATALLGDLQKQLMKRFDSLKVAYEQRMKASSFAPHINLGDLRLGPSSNLLPDLSLPIVWRVEKLTIYRSELSHSGANYSTMSHISLQ